MKTGEGRNELGKILMVLRDDFRTNGVTDRSGLIPERSFGPVRGMRVRYADIANADCDVIVNAANCEMIGGSGVDGSIHSEAGYELYEECRKIGRIDHGGMCVTKGYRAFPRRKAHRLSADFRRQVLLPQAACRAHRRNDGLRLARRA